MNDMFRDASDELAHVVDSFLKGEFDMQYGQMPSDVNTDLLTIQVKCTSCDAVTDTTICAESLDSDYTLNEDGETYTSLYGECAECLTGESSEDRLERQAQAHLEAAALHRDDPMF
jgi:hypothetical protein